MNKSLIDRIVTAVMYEGYLLYPYRPSVKNIRRWTFGGLYPPGHSAATQGSDACRMQTQCLLQANSQATVGVQLRFLQVVDRTIGQLETLLARLPDDGEPSHQLVASLTVVGQTYQPWQEGREREIAMESVPIHSLLKEKQNQVFQFPAERIIEPILNDSGRVAGLLIRTHQTIQGNLELSIETLGSNLYRLTLQIANTLPLADIAETRTRSEVELQAMMSTHAVLHADGGRFISLTDPPEALRQATDDCVNVGNWPALVGEEGATDVLLASPIILPDYPQIAGESPGDMFDATEIDEILSLRVMTLTDDEKLQVATTDDRARAMLQRTESLAREQMMNLHGTMRDVESLTE